MSEHDERCSAYDEVEEGTVLRTLVDWRLFNQSNELVSLDELGEGKPFCSVTGFLIKPLPKSIRAKVVENLCTYGVSTKDGVDREPIVVKEQMVKDTIPVEWGNLRVGDYLDGYCDKTMKWHKARIIDIIRDEPVRFKVHFNGWKPKHDEWLEKCSPRLAALGQHTDVVMVDVVKPPLIPWYENTAIQALIAKEAMEVPDSDERYEVTITDIEDWCVDYAYANPSLYLISNEGPWYRVMGSLVPGGGGSGGGISPSQPLDNPIADIFLEKFVAAAHCAYCLIEFLPTNRKLSFQNVADEVDSRSGGRIDDVILLMHAKFIIDQLSSLTTNDLAADKEIKFEDSYFMTQFKKKSEQYLNLKNEKKHRKRLVCKSLMDKSCGGVVDLSIKVVPVRVKAKAKKQEPIVPIKDSDYWRAQDSPPAPPPCPQNSHQLLPLDCSHLLGDFLEAWSILANYKEFLSLPDISIEQLLNELQKTQNTPCCGSLQDIHIQLLLPMVLLHTGGGGGAGHQTTAYSCAFPNVASEGSDARYSPNSVLLWDSIQECCKLSSDPVTLVKQFLRQGDLWVEVIRVLLSDRGEIAMPAEYVDTALVMQGMVEDLLVSPAYQSLLSKELEVTPKELEVTSASPRDVQYPKDLSSILNAIKCGFYEGGLVTHDALHEANEEIDMPKYCITLRCGTKMDAYSPILHSWYNCEVVEIFPQEGKVLVSFPGWGVGFDESFSVHGKYMAPHRTLSLSVECKDTHPDLLPGVLLADMEHKYRKEHLRALNRPAGYVPHEAIASDVKRVLLQNMRMPNMGDEVLEEFLQAYESKIVGASSTPILVDSSADCNGDFQDIAQYLSQSSYESAPLAMKIRLLCWLCEAMVGSNRAKNYLEDVLEQKLALEKASRMGTKSKQEDNEDSAESSEKISCSGKRRASDMLEESNGGGEGAGSGGSGGTPVEKIPSEEIVAFDYRVLPLGKDRNNSTYWVFKKDNGQSSSLPCLRIFCEDHASPGWKVFSDDADIQLLLSWLSDYGIKEVALKQKIRTLLGVSPLAPDTSSMLAGTAAAAAAPPMHARYVDVLLGADGRLAAGVKDLDGRVIISTFKLDEQNHSCAKDAGILICDQLISLNAHPIHDIVSLQKAIALVKQTHASSSSDGEGGIAAGDGVILSFLIIRYSSPARSVPAISIALSTDAEFRAHFQVQQGMQQQQQENPHATLPQTCVVADKLVGVCFEMLHSTAGVYPSSPQYEFLGFRHFIKKISEILYTMRCENASLSPAEKEVQSNILISCLRDCLLDMEFALSQTGRGLTSAWGENRRQFKWKQYCQAANTFPKVAFCAFSLYQSVDWVELAEITCIVDHFKAQSYVSKQVYGYIPKPGHQIIFFGDSYFSHYNSNPILECVGDIPRSRVVCKVLSVKHYKGGSDSVSKEKIPYAKLVLQTVEENGATRGQHPQISHVASSYEKKKLNRLLNLAVFVLLALPESVPFSSAVSATDCPNYYDIIANPMHLGNVQQKVLDQQYTSLQEFLNDVDTIRDNCIQYCAEPYPSLLPLVETLHAAALDLIRRLSPLLSGTGDIGTGTGTCIDTVRDTETTAKDIPSDTTVEGAIGSTFSLCVPLNSIKYDSFIVNIDKYHKAAKAKMQLEDTFHILVDHVVREEEGDDAQTVVKRKGTIVGEKSASHCSSSNIVPWRCLEVEWDEDDPQDQCGLFGTVNPWEIVLSKCKLP